MIVSNYHQRAIRTRSLKPRSGQHARLAVGVLALALLALALAACSPGGATNAGSAPPTATHQPAPIHVPNGYQGLISITFSPGTPYQQAADSVKQAGLKLAVPCPNAGPIIAGATPRPTDQRDTFTETHKLTAIGDPALTRAMLNQIAASAGVTSVDSLPPLECPLIGGSAG